MKNPLQRGVCQDCRNTIWLWQEHTGAFHVECIPDIPILGAPHTVAVLAEQTRLEQAIRDEFDHFEAVHLDGDKNRMNRLYSGRLCEDVVRVIMREIRIKEI